MASGLSAGFSSSHALPYSASKSSSAHTCLLNSIYPSACSLSSLRCLTDDYHLLLDCFFPKPTLPDVTNPFSSGGHESLQSLTREAWSSYKPLFLSHPTFSSSNYWSCWFYLQYISRIQLPLMTLVPTTITSCLDYCKSLRTTSYFSLRPLWSVLTIATEWSFYSRSQRV